ncbi:MAG: hypothetical protein F4X65_09530 [Chloroflexi bacterium]|nr:hypothetical protein [Chloroflexota bacterium]
MPSRADAHDLDKLNRWWSDLESTGPEAPPVYAIFLVSGEDTGAHNIFRAFRTSFEERKLGFAHLVIFGQHGVSGTVRQLRSHFGVPEDGGPTLILFAGESLQPEVVGLPSGSSTGKDLVNDSSGVPDWPEALKRTEAVIADGGAGGSETLASVKGLCARVLELEQS